MKKLPIEEVLEQLIKALTLRDEVILEAPPGAGKTTMVPIALMNQAWLDGQKIIVLEPRRIAAKSAAIRMSELLTTKIGTTVGYKVRLENCCSKETRIEVITEGVLTRMLLQDPSLEGIGLIIFDEFHERSLNNDLNLALCLQARELFREENPLKLLLMSATADSQTSAKLLNNAPIVSSKGKSYPVEIIYSAQQPKYNAQHNSLEQRIVSLIRQITSEKNTDINNSILVFLPGQREIENISQLLKTQNQNALDTIEVVPLYGSLSFAKQQYAIQPATPKTAQKPLTIEFIRRKHPDMILRKKRIKNST